MNKLNHSRDISFHNGFVSDDSLDSMRDDLAHRDGGYQKPPKTIHEHRTVGEAPREFSKDELLDGLISSAKQMPSALTYCNLGRYYWKAFHDGENALLWLSKAVDYNDPDAKELIDEITRAMHDDADEQRAEGSLPKVLLDNRNVQRVQMQVATGNKVEKMTAIRITVSPMPQHKADIDFVSEWLSYAEQGRENIFFSFFCQFLALNHLYETAECRGDLRFNDYDEYHTVISSRKPKTDMEKLIAFLDAQVVKGGIRVEFSDKQYRILKSVKRMKRDAEASQGDLAPPPLAWEYERNRVLAGYIDYVRNRHRQSGQYGERVEENTIRLVEIMVKIYRVRCNLFHGAKHPSNERDRLLVETSNEILGRFLVECTKRKLGLYHWSENHDNGASTDPCGTVEGCTNGDATERRND